MGKEVWYHPETDEIIIYNTVDRTAQIDHPIFIYETHCFVYGGMFRPWIKIGVL